MADWDALIQSRKNLFLRCMYIKPTNTFSYLLTNSNHPEFIFNNIPKSLFIRIRRICDSLIDYYQTLKTAEPEEPETRNPNTKPEPRTPNPSYPKNLKPEPETRTRKPEIFKFWIQNLKFKKKILILVLLITTFYSKNFRFQV